MKRQLSLVPEPTEPRTTTHHLPPDLYDMIFGSTNPKRRTHRHLTLVV